MADREEDDDAQELDPRVMLVPELLPGDRCKTEPGGRNAEVRFVGKVPGMRGFWVGVQYDEKVGKNDGVLNGKRYFRCPAGHGGSNGAELSALLGVFVARKNMRSASFSF